MLHVVVWKWKPDIPYRTKFTAEHVNVCRRMVQRHYKGPHEFCCITDDPLGLEEGIRWIPLWPDHSKLLNPSVKNGPSCYRRLKAFSKEAADLIGERFVSLDLDCVITADLGPLWDRDDDFVIWDAGKQWGTFSPQRYNGSMFLLKAGSRTCLWEEFDPLNTPRKVQEAGFRGSDQGWMCYRLGKEKTWTRDDGVLSYRKDITPNQWRLPSQARIVFFHGKFDPWMKDVQRLAPWVQQHWR